MRAQLFLLLVTLYASNVLSQSRVGVNTTTPGSTFSVNGEASIGAAYSLLSTPTNGAIIEGKVGIGTPLPTAGLHLVNNDGILAQGINGSGTILSLGAGTRMMWYPKKSSFRAGYVDGTQWDDANIGLGSAAMGIGTTASGENSTAMGYYTIASGESSTAMGYGATANGLNSIAMGSNTTADGEVSTAMGSNTAANGEISTAIGRNVVAQAYSETVIGSCNTTATIQNPTAWVATDKLFTIGNGQNPSNRSNALVMLKNGNMGIGTTAPTTPTMGLHQINNNGMLLEGTYGSGNTLSASGAGTRMIWYPKKAAFRVGSVTGATWDNDSIGNYSTAIGYNTTATGNGAFALGRFTRASGIAATALGDSTTASGLFSTVMGYQSIASGAISTAMGYSMASGELSFAEGVGSIASGDLSIAMGSNALASGISATAIGSSVEATGYDALATGAFSVASGERSTAMGSQTIASGDASTAMGFVAKAEAYCETTIGSFNTNASSPNPTAWVTTDRLFTIGNGNFVTPSDALIILKNGNATHYGTVTATAFITPSDSRFKHNILPLASVSGSVLQNLAKINAYTYDYRVAEFPDRKFAETRQIGFLAQELEKVYPEMVITDDKGYKSVDYAKITPVLVEAIKELKAQNEILMLKNEALSSQAEKAEVNFNVLKAQVEKLTSATLGTVQK